MAHRPVGMILTAGFGTRLRPLTFLRPKPVMEIAGKPIIFFLIRMLEKAGIRDIFLNLHHQAEHIRNCVAQHQFSARIHFVREEEILGTAGGIANVIRRFGITNRSMVVLHGDIIVDLDLAPYLSTMDFCTLICAKDHVVPGYIGSVGINRRHEIVELGRFYRSQGEIDQRGFFTGIHILSPDAVSEIAESREVSLIADLCPRWLKSGRVLKGIVRPLQYDDLGSAQRIFQANMTILHGARFEAVNLFEGLRPMPGREGIMMGDNVKVSPLARLVPPLFLSSGATVHEDAELGPHVVLGADVCIGAHARIKNSVVFSRTNIEKDELLDCMLALRSARVLVKGS